MHPPALLMNIPENINKCHSAVPESAWRERLQEKVTYNPHQKRKRNRHRKSIWCNPPWKANVNTNLGSKFLNIPARCFPNGHPLHKIFNKDTLKLSYSCMPNMKSIISSQNKALLSDYHRLQTQTSDKECNCRKTDQCPLDRKCLTQNVVSQETVSTQTSSESYVGLATNFKERYRNHGLVAIEMNGENTK